LDLNEFEEKKRFIFNYLDISESRTNLVKLAYKILDTQLREFIIYSDGSVTNIGRIDVESTFAFMIMDNFYKKIGEYASASRYWVSSYRAETFGLLTSILILPKNSKVKIYTDSQLMIENFNSINKLDNVN
jgi:ribonuclease HI